MFSKFRGYSVVKEKKVLVSMGIIDGEGNRDGELLRSKREIGVLSGWILG